MNGNLQSYCSLSATTALSEAGARRRLVNAEAVLLCVHGSQTFLLQNAVWKRCKTKLLNCKGKKNKGEKQKAPFPLLIEFKGITCSTLQQMGSYTNFKTIKRYKVPCGAGLH